MPRAVWRGSRAGRPLAALAVLLLVAASCGGSGSGSGEGLSVAASIYPLAFLARALGVPAGDVTDLTPPGGEPHDSILSPTEREAMQTADLVLYLGQYRFQPEIEAAAGQENGKVVAVADGLHLDITHDPHVWLDPPLMAKMAKRAATALAAVEPARLRRALPSRLRTLDDRLSAIDRDYRLGLRQCRYDTAVVSHEAFAYLLGRYGLHQIGFSPVNPEGEPRPQDLQHATNAISSGHAGAVFYEAGGETTELARNFAHQEHVPALPLFTMEVAPPQGYLLGMEANLRALRKGLVCR